MRGHRSPGMRRRQQASQVPSCSPQTHTRPGRSQGLHNVRMQIKPQASPQMGVLGIGNACSIQSRPSCSQRQSSVELITTSRACNVSRTHESASVLSMSTAANSLNSFSAGVHATSPITTLSTAALSTLNSVIPTAPFVLPSPASRFSSLSSMSSSATALSNQEEAALAARLQATPASLSSLPSLSTHGHNQGNTTLSPNQQVTPHAQSTPTPRQILEETITAVRMRPNPHLLQVIRLAGGIGDEFTMRQIIHYVKEYIGQRFMYDQQDPRIVYCDGDLLGQALGVKQFTILQAMQRNCTLVQDSCIRLSRHIEARPEEQPDTPGEVGGERDNPPVPSRSAVPVSASASVQKAYNMYRENVSVPDSSSSCLSVSGPSVESLAASSQDSMFGSVGGQPAASVEPPTSTTDESAMMTSTTASQESSSILSQTDISSSLGSQDIGLCASHLESRNLSQPPLPSQPSSSLSSSASSTSAVINFKAAKSSVTLSDQDLRDNGMGQQSSTDSSNEESNHSQSKRKGAPRRGQAITSPQGQGTSINVQLDEPDGDVGAWACRVSVQAGFSEPSNIGEGAEDDTVVLEYESDTFSVEYEVASSSDEMEGEREGQRSKAGASISRARSISEGSSHSSGPGTRTAMLVVCKESDVEYLADYSDTDTGSDAELSDGDKWLCSCCNVKNPPFQRNCSGCWSVRSDWLPLKNDKSGELASSITEECNIIECAVISKNENRNAETHEGKNFCAPNENKGSQIKASAYLRNSVDNSKYFRNKFATSSCVTGASNSEAATKKDINSSLTVTSSSDDSAKAITGAAVDQDKDCQHTDSSTQHDLKAMTAASKLKAKKRHYSSGLSTSDSQDDCSKNKSKPPQINADSKKELEFVDTCVKKAPTRKQPSSKPRRQRTASYYSAPTLGALAKNEACVVCLTRPKTASIIHAGTDLPTTPHLAGKSRIFASVPQSRMFS
ncbi:E3 ubiquitin-protein ligase mdm2 [Plakobranchus ocellatus]|uniref:E3 ubiquitin-protein ligase mdm2 n=1 Tax=Plakobranchus ocellatus TaxID=259542 RepID=A0AAV3YC01_9GAST|nr:E3 ubiquitin-protein ligase mdm2 [Plakobranchus ocellatus]